MMDNILFSLGAVTLIDRTATPAQATQVAVLQDLGVEFTADDKELYGGGRFPVALAQGKAKVTLKVKSGAWNAGALARMLGGTASTGTVRQLTEAKPIATNQATATKSSTWVDDLGVRDASGNPMKRVASAPTAGQFSVAAGIYTFAAGEVSPVTLSYSYTDTTGTTIAVGQAMAGSCPSFEVTCFNEYTDSLGSTCRKGYRFYAVVFPKLADAAKNDDFSTMDLEGKCLARASDGKAYDLYLG